MQICRFFVCRIFLLSFSFPCTLTSRHSGDFDMILLTQFLQSYINYTYRLRIAPYPKKKKIECASLLESSPSTSRSSKISLSLFLHLTFHTHFSHFPINATSFDRSSPVYKDPLQILCFRSKHEVRGRNVTERCVLFTKLILVHLTMETRFPQN